MNQYPFNADVFIILSNCCNFLRRTVMAWYWLMEIVIWPWTRRIDMWIGNSVISIKQLLGLISWPKSSNLRTGFSRCRFSFNANSFCYCNILINSLSLCAFFLIVGDILRIEYVLLVDWHWYQQTFVVWHCKWVRNRKSTNLCVLIF